MRDDEDNEGRATARIVEVGSGKTVGLLYVWEDGVRQPLWFNGERSDVDITILFEAEHLHRNRRG